ncbi:flagellar basal body P-ring protein FlgI [Azospirillum rugosum]|uniref:Flagellar P-ring protein n=1 Tax=Azospirillum rugosum TaxID=416170 RepID=A0ABS4STZ7_9PROT|nr:flagellar basal body P-ring protein FlgI [Azospirillum rugosum]MBP2296036.1 flagellar P-ring protein precursor FlgI [Azospirillum rugosum]MDQ0529626.1 flagellar P-ring protein precursor FlgI [Azospirillum rugosum]
MAVGLALAVLGPALPAMAQTRVKDLVTFDGVRRNQLIGYGLVVGLNGTGDRLINTPFTEQSLKGMLERLGINTRDEVLRTRNAAAVMVTASLPPFARQGTTIDITVAALGDATSLLGGTLLVTPLLGADGQAYAVAQGALSVSGFSVGGSAANVTKGVPTSARVANGAIVERELKFALDEVAGVRMALRNPDFTTANRIADAVNVRLGTGNARVLDATTVDVRIPPRYSGAVARLIGDIELLTVRPDGVARVVVDERSGTVVIGDDVRISKVAITQGNLTVRVVETPQVSQPQPFSDGQTVVVPRTDVQVQEGNGRQFVTIGGNVSLQQLVNGLNALGVGPRDMVAILQAIKAAGALHADLEII